LNKTNKTPNIPDYYYAANFKTCSFFIQSAEYYQLNTLYKPFTALFPAVKILIAGMSDAIKTNKKLILELFDFSGV